MKKSRSTGCLDFVAAAVVAAVATVCQAAAAERPNIIVIFMDDMGYNDVGAMTYPAPPGQYPVTGPAPKLEPYTDPDLPAPNHARFLTPHIDSLASDGLSMPQFYVTPLCSLSRASLMTGRYCKRVGVNQVFFPDQSGVQAKGLNTREVTLPELLRQEGYSTGMVGKWHLGYVPTEHQPFQMMPTRNGFEEFYGHPHSNDMNHLDLIRNETVLEADFRSPAAQSQFTWRYTEAALDFIERKSAGDRPFFLYLAHIMTHVQCWPSDREFTNADGTIWPKFLGTSGVSQYYDVVREIDHSVGRVLGKLDELGIDEKTLVIFTSDNGPWLSLENYNKAPAAPDLKQYSVGSSYPLRDGKFTTYEGGVRVPFFARWTGKITPGRVLGDQVGAITDLLPTFAGLAGAALPGDRTIDGIDLWPVWSGQAAPGSRVFAHFKSGGTMEALVKDKWKLHTTKLYDLSDLNDQESTDQAASEPAVLADLQAEKAAIQTSLAAETEALGEFTPYEVQLSADEVHVPEGGTGNLRLRLSADPGGSVTVTTTFFSGDSDLAVSAGGSLSFNSANWSAWQTVTLSAAQDTDGKSGGATFRVKMNGFSVVREVYAFEEDDESPPGVTVSFVWPKVSPATIAGSGVKLIAEGSANVGGALDPDGTSYTWHKVKGPGVVTFSQPDARKTGVGFSQDGSYRIRLVADHATGAGSADFVVKVRAAQATAAGPETSAVLSYDASVSSDAGSFWKNLTANVPGERDWALSSGMARTSVDPAPGLSFIDSAWVFPGGTTGTGGTSPHLDAYGWGDASVELWFKPSNLPTSSRQVLWETGGNVGASLTLEGSTLRFAVDGGVGNTIAGALASATLAPLAAQDGFIHCVGVIDLDGDEIRLFVDGALADTRAIPALTDWTGVSLSGLGKVDTTPETAAAPTAEIDFDPAGELVSQFSGGPYSEASGVGLGGSIGVTLANSNVTSFDGSQSVSLAAGEFAIGESFTVGACFKMSGFGTATGTSGQILRLGLTNGGSDNFASLPFGSIEMVNPATGLAKFVIRDTNPGVPSFASFTLTTGQWYRFETTFTRSGAAAVDYDFSIAPCSADGTPGTVLASDDASNVGGGLTGSTELDKILYGGFKGHEAYINGASGVLDRFSVTAGGLLEPVVDFDDLGGNDLLSGPIGEFAGQIAVMRFYDRALSGAEVGELANGPKVANVAPNVSAGNDQTGDTRTGVPLVASVDDDGIPAGSPITTLWRQESGPDSTTDFPATAAFENTSSPSTNVRFSVPGVYQLELDADDSEIKVSDSMQVTVSPLGYADWASAIAFPPGQETGGSNPDHDRFDNLWEWILGYDPLQPNAAHPGPSFSSHPEGASARFIFEMDVPRDRRPDVFLDESDDLKIWDRVVNHETTMVPVSDSHARWTFSYHLPASEPRWFLRAVASE